MANIFDQLAEQEKNLEKTGKATPNTPDAASSVFSRLAAEDALQQPPAVPDILEHKAGLMTRLADILQRPLRAFTIPEKAIVESIQTGTTKPLTQASAAAQENISPLSIGRTLFKGKLPSPESQVYTSDVLKAAGVPELGSLQFGTERISPETGKVEGVGVGPRITGRGALGFIGDVAQDPITYITGGFSAGPKVGGKILSKQGVKYLKNSTEQAAKEISAELAEQGIKKTPKELIQEVVTDTGKSAARARAEKTFLKTIETDNKAFNKLIDRGGLKFAGRTLIPQEPFTRLGQVLGKTPGIKQAKDVVGGLFKRDYGLDDNAKTLFDEYRTRVGSQTDEVIQGVIDTFKKGDKVIDLDGRQLIYRALAKAEDQSKELLADRLLNIQNATAQRKLLETIRKSPNFKEAEKVGRAGERLGKVDIDSAAGLQGYKQTLLDDLHDITNKLDNPDISNTEFSALVEQARNYEDVLKATPVDDLLFKNIATNSIKELPEGLQQSAKELHQILRTAEKEDIRAGLLKRIIPNYVPRKYLSLHDATGVIQNAKGVIKSLGSRAKKRKLNTLAEAKEYALKHGGGLVEDAAVPVAERLIRGVKAREGVKLSNKLKELYKGEIPELVQKHLASVDKGLHLSDPTTAWALQKYDQVLDFYKGSLTGIFPAFHARNMVSNRFLSFLGGGAETINPITIKHGLNLKTGKNGYIINNFGERIGYDEIRKQAAKHQVTKGFWGGDLMNPIQEQLQIGFRTKIKDITKHPLQAGRRVGSHIEQTDRMTLFAAFLKKGMDFETAAKNVDKFLFDYDNLSWFEKNIMKRVIPFYTFHRKAVELFATELIKQPRVFNTLDDFKRFLEDNQMSVHDLGKLPSYLQNRIKIKVGENQYMTGIDLGFENILENIQNPSSILSQISPPLKLPLEQLSGRQFFGDKSLSEAAKNLKDIPTWMIAFPGTKTLTPLGKFIGAREVDTFDYKLGEPSKKWIATNPRNVNLLRNFPTSRVLNVASSPERDSLGNTISKFLTGISVKEYDPTTADYWKRKEVEHQLMELGIGREFRKFYLPRDDEGFIKDDIPSDVLEFLGIKPKVKPRKKKRSK